MFENRGITVTSTAGYDSNANGRAERAVLYFTEKVALYCRLGFDRKHFRSNYRNYGLSQFSTLEKFIGVKCLVNRAVSMNLDNVCYQR